MTRVLALDLARVTGWAVGTPSGVERFGTHEFVQTRSFGEYGMAARMTFRRMLSTIKPDLVVFEQPILRAGKIKTRGNGRAFVASIDTPEKLRKIYGLPFELAVESFRAEIEIDEANIGQVRSFFLMGKVPRTTIECKLAVKVMCRRRGWQIRDDNEADALAVLAWKLSKIDPSAQTALNLRAGESAQLSSCGADAFARSTTPSKPASSKDAAADRPSSSAGAASASSTGRGSPGKTMATIRQSGGVMSSISSGSQRMLQLREPGEIELRRSRR